MREPLPEPLREPVVDAHHHIWRQADLPWLQGEMQPRIFGEYRAIMRDYPIEEFREDVAGQNVVASVYVQANWPPHRALDEARWVDGVADGEGAGWPQAIVAFADLGAPNAARALEELAAIRRVTGVRQQLHWHEKPLYRFAGRPDAMADPSWREGFRRLAAQGLLFELQIFTSQMRDGAALADDFPDTTIVLEHAGMLEDRSPEGWSAWRTGMRELARRPNVHVKLSGLGTFVRAAGADLMRPVVEETVALFSPARCVWGSNFPIEKLWTDYDALCDAFRETVAGLTATERDAVLCGNAMRLYRIEAGQGAAHG